MHVGQLGHLVKEMVVMAACMQHTLVGTLDVEHLHSMHKVVTVAWTGLLLSGMTAHCNHKLLLRGPRSIHGCADIARGGIREEAGGGIYVCSLSLLRTVSLLEFVFFDFSVHQQSMGSGKIALAKRDDL